MDLVQPYIAIALKLVTGMIGTLVFLRIAGKAQMAQITPLDTVSAFVIRYVNMAYSLCFNRVDAIQYACSFRYAVVALTPFHKRGECLSCKRWCNKF